MARKRKSAAPHDQRSSKRIQAKGKSRALPDSQSTTGKPKRKKSSQLQSHHLSQSSIDVPLAVKEAVKASQGKRCWMCNQRANKRYRPLEIAHILPQAARHRSRFVAWHKAGLIQLDNIHDQANRVALCSKCHFAFDSQEWTFLPVEIATLVREAKANPEKDFIPEWNARRDIVFRRWRLIANTGSEASADKAYISAFTSEPTKVWPGELGAVVLANGALTLNPPNEDEDLTEAIGQYAKLQAIWRRHHNPCSKEECSICRQEMIKSGSDDNHGGEDGETDGNGDHGHDHDYGDNGGDDESDSDDGEDGEDDDHDEGDKAGPAHTPRVYHKSHRYETRQSSTLTICPIPRPTSRKASARKASALHDKSVPYSHREGYTWRNTTANELMAIWQGLPYVKKPNGQIIITGVSYRERPV